MTRGEAGDVRSLWFFHCERCGHRAGAHTLYRWGDQWAHGGCDRPDCDCPEYVDAEAVAH